MAYTETKTTGYGQRVGSSFKGIGTGFVLFLGATALLWWNEGRAVHRSQDIKEVGKNAVHIENIESLDASLEGTLIHANGTAATEDILTDATFGVSENAVQLQRTVEYYQWEEHSRTETKEKIGGSKEEVTTYTYDKAWSSSPISSSSFHDPDYKNTNWIISSFDDASSYAANVSFGAYKLNESQIHSVAASATREDATINLTPEQIAEMNEAVAREIRAHNNLVANDTDMEYVHVSGNQIYLGRSTTNPEVGDVRITITKKVLPLNISLVAVVKGNTFTSYATKNGSNDTYLSAGTKTLDEMMQAAEEANTTLTWILRILGIVLVCAGLKMIFDLLVTLLKVLPFLANILNWGVKLVCNVLGFAWSLIIIALAWIWYRPILGISLLVVAGALVYFLVIKGKDKKGAAVPAEA